MTAFDRKTRDYLQDLIVEAYDLVSNIGFMIDTEIKENRTYFYNTDLKRLCLLYVMAMNRLDRRYEKSNSYRTARLLYEHTIKQLKNKP